MSSAAYLLVLVTILKISTLSSADKTYKAAIFEHAVTQKSTLQETFDDSLGAYAGNASLAAAQGADIIVFPEYGIGRMGIDESRENLTNYAQEVPDPATKRWIPCDDNLPSPPNIQMLVRLSCIAKLNSIAVLGNLISRVPCDSSTDSTCPKDNQFLYNTNVIFDKNGTLVARYWKHHLFREFNLDPAPKDGFTIVDLGFAKFGTIVCFDIMFSDPLIEYVTKHGIKNILYPTNWVNNMPLAGSVQTFASIAHGLGINIIAANHHLPRFGSLGSGIYSGTKGAIVEVNDLAVPYKLLIADVSVDPPSVPTLPSNQCPSWVKEPCNHFDPHTAKILISGAPQIVVGKLPATGPTDDINAIWYTPLDKTAFVFLNETATDATLCQDGACCHLKYEFATKDNNVHYVLAGASGYFSEELPIYTQFCIVVRCEMQNISTCGKIPEGETMTRFNRLELSGDFNTGFLYPNILSTKLENIKPNKWNFNKTKSCPDQSCKRITGTISANSITDEHILVMRILGRMYERDDFAQLSGSNPLQFGLKLLLSCCLFLMIFYGIHI